MLELVSAVLGVYALINIVGAIASRCSPRFRRWLVDVQANYQHVPR